MSTPLRDERFTVAEAAFLTDLPPAAIHRAIDGGVIAARRVRGHRGVSREIGLTEIIFLHLVKSVSGTLKPGGRRELYRLLRASPKVPARVRLGPISVEVSAVRQEVRRRRLALRRAHRLIARDPEIRGGEPVIRGTRVPVHLIADLVKQGASPEELLVDYPSINREQVKAALAYAEAHPRRGRPRTRPWSRPLLG
jgi:uncharacterized protein (DUF433 family)